MTMNIGKLLTGLLVLTLAFFLQLWFPVAGIHGDFVLAALVALAFIFPFWELVFFVLLAVFIVNWQPGFSADFLLFALLPFAAFVLHRWLKWESWLGVAVLTAGAILLFYGTTAPAVFLPNIGALVADAIACVVFGEIVLWGASG